ncbi:sensor domain-containing diguanylate cyclase [Shinella sp. JR1-6]|uniref:GGDEF domain-containing protein n=1 Tax=Shinella sp. JR1-6 TaxID=2527671 RepID=UPI00102D535E|nr:sensor domain-containing diguanylate cyclase [Shinella sp. JR1-6]TAA56401.1 diguanylate cyclase [Shinella sp. JR1-6]
MSSTASQRTKTDDVPYGRSREDVDFWMGCVGAPMVLVEKGTLHVRRANSNAAVLFGLGLEAFENLPIEDLVGREASILLSQIWSVAPIGVPGEPFLIRAMVQAQERVLMVQVTKIAIEGELVRLFTFTDAPPQGSVSLAGWQEQMISLLDWLPFGFEIASSDDQIQFANSTFKALFGYTQDEIESIEDWWRLVYPDPQYREYARTQWHSSIADARRENREMTPFDLDVRTASGATKRIQFRQRTVGNFNVNLYIDVTKERAYAEQLKVLANADPLTGILNRRRFFEEAEEIFSRSSGAASMGVLMLDIDHFKSINDTHGHRAGDLVLMEFARRCQEVVRSGDRFARLGGEEFAVLLAAEEPVAAVTLAERIRMAIHASPFDIEGAVIPVSVSIGATLADPSEEPFGSAILRADNALYEAKRTGRNRVVMLGA